MKAIQLLAIVLLQVCAFSAEQTKFRDEFNGRLGEGWSWKRENPAGWRVTDQGLEIRVEPGNMWGGENNAKNVLLRSAPDPTVSDVEVQVTLGNRPTGQYEQVDLVWYYDDGHMVKLGQEQVDGRLCIVMGREEGDRTRTIVIIPIDFFILDLRFQVRDNRIAGQYRKSGTTEWLDAGACDLPVRGEPRVSIQCYQGPVREERWARITEFEIRATAR